MRRVTFLLAIALLATLPAFAQIGKQPIVRAGSPEDRALREIDEATDLAKKQELLDKFLADYGQGEVALLAYEKYVALFTSTKDYDKAFEYGEKALALDPDSFSTAFALVRAAEEKGDAARAMDYGERCAAILQRYRASAAPEGTDSVTWEERKKQTLTSLQERINYIHYAIYRLALGVQDPSAKAALLERYANAFPESPLVSMAQMVVTDAYQQARNPAKMVSFAQKALERDPENFWMLVVLADYWAGQREQLDKAEEYARKALDLLDKAAKPEQFTEEQWAQQKGLQQGLANSALGQILALKGRDAQAVEALRTAIPLLKPYPFYYARNQYFLGFTLAKMKRVAEARPVLTEAAEIDSPYRALAQDTLNKIGGPARKAPAKKRP